MSKQDVFAEPMLDSDEYLGVYVQQLKKLQKEGKLPNLEQEMKYGVFAISGSKFGAHKSIVLSSNYEDFVTVELGFCEANGIKHIFPVTQVFDSSQKHKLEYHGTVKMSGGKLIAHAITTTKKFGSYFKFCNNCQDFCNMYLESIGLAEEKSLTDGDVTAIGAIVVGVVTILSILFSRV